MTFLDQFGKPLTLSQHNSVEHTIGEELPAPTIILPNGSVSSLGTSSVPAREDHVHGIERGLAVDKPTTGLYQGRQYYETDTYRLVEWQSVVTGWTLPWSLPWGHQGSSGPNNQVSVVTTAGTTEIAFLQGNLFTAVANRRILITVTMSGYGSVSADQFIFNIRAGNTVAGTLIGKGHRITVGIAASYSETPITFFDIDSPAAGSRQYLMSCVRATGTGTYTIEDADVRTNWITTEDIGPAAAPA